jgi:hypothetical protein
MVKMVFLKMVAVLLMALMPLSPYGQDSLVTNSPPSDTGTTTMANADPMEPPSSNETVVLPISRLEFDLSLWVLGFGFLVILLEIFLISRRNIHSEDIIKFIVVTIIIISTMFLITAGYSNNQVAPAVGLLGTIAGYLLGKADSSKKQQNETH